MSSRRFDKDEYICLSHMSSEDVFKTSWSGSIYSPWPYVFKTPCHDVFKMFLKRLKDVLQKCLQDMFKTFWRRIIKLNFFFSMSSRSIQHVSETYRQKGSLKKVLSEISQNSQEKSVPKSLLLAKLNFVDLQLH